MRQQSRVAACMLVMTMPGRVSGFSRHLCRSAVTPQRHLKQSTCMRVVDKNEMINDMTNEMMVEFRDGGDESSLFKQPPPSSTPYLEPLLRMCRLGNVPSVVLMHVLGIHVTCRSSLFVAGNASSGSVPLLLQELLLPGTLMTLLCTLLVSASSMVVNDYFDAKNGNDFWNERLKAANQRPPASQPPAPASSQLDYEPVPTSTKPIVSGQVPLFAVKEFLVLLYVTLASFTCLVPGSLTQLCIVFAGCMTYAYSNHIKPHTGWKNVSCALLVALCPLVSSMAVLEQGLHVTGTPGLGFLGSMAGCIFAGCFSREIVMDIADYEGDKAVGVNTIAVKHGKRTAAQVAMAASIALAFLSVAPPLHDLLLPQQLQAAQVTVHHVFPPLLRFLLASLGSSIAAYKTHQVLQTDGEEYQLCHEAIESGKLGLLFLLASYI